MSSSGHSGLDASAGRVGDILHIIRDVTFGSVATPEHCSRDSATHLPLSLTSLHTDSAPIGVILVLRIASQSLCGTALHSSDAFAHLILVGALENGFTCEDTIRRNAGISANTYHRQRLWPNKVQQKASSQLGLYALLHLSWSRF